MALRDTQDCLIFELPRSGGTTRGTQDCLIFEVPVLPAPLYPVTLPAPPGPQEYTLSFENLAGENDSPFSFGDGVFLWPGDMFTAEATWPPMLAGQAEPLISALALLYGKYATVLLPDYNRLTPQGPMSGSPVVRSANSAGSNQLLVRGATPSIGRWAVAGDYIQVTAAGGQQRLHKVLADANTDVNGFTTLSIRPSIREALADGVSIVTVNCAGTFRMQSNRSPWKIDRNGVYTVSFKAREALLP